MTRCTWVTLVFFAFTASAQNLAVRGNTIYTMAGAPIRNGVVLIENGKITRVGPVAGIQTPARVETWSAEIVTPGLVDAHSVVGLTEYLNTSNDQEEIERSAAIQPELRAIDAYDPRERLSNSAG